MRKLLHERLRNGEIQLPDHTYMSTNAFDLFCERLADEIERCYIPRPRFEDGEPVQFGDSAMTRSHGGTEHVSRIAFTASGFYFNTSKGNVKRYGYGESVIRRPRPKVLDADGVPIKVGDTVWFVSNEDYEGIPFEVEDLDSGVGLTADYENRSIFIGCNSGVAYPSDLTHKEPDSLEKLRDDMALDASADGAAISTTKLGVFATRLSALIERGA